MLDVDVLLDRPVGLRARTTGSTSVAVDLVTNAASADSVMPSMALTGSLNFCLLPGIVKTSFIKKLVSNKNYLRD